MVAEPKLPKRSTIVASGKGGTYQNRLGRHRILIYNWIKGLTIGKKRVSSIEI